VDLGSVTTERSRAFRIRWWRFTWDLESTQESHEARHKTAHRSAIAYRPTYFIADLNVLGFSRSYCYRLWSAIGINPPHHHVVRPSAGPSVLCNVVHCGSQGRCTGL